MAISGKKICTGLLTFIVALLQIGCCIAIICIVAIHLDDASLEFDFSSFSNFINYTEASCLLGNSWNGGSLCNYAYAVCAISIATMLCLALLLLITCNCCGFGKFMELLVAACGLAWWIICSIILTEQINDSPSLDNLVNGNTLSNYRTAVEALSWTSVGLFGVLCILHLVYIFIDCCGGRKKKEKEEKYDAPPPPPPAQHYSSAAPSAPPAPNQQFIVAVNQ